MQAIKEYKTWSGRMFPTWSEVLEVLGELGYQKSFRRVATEIHALLAWPHGRDDRSCAARLLGVGANRAMLECAELPLQGAHARFCLIEPVSTCWADATITEVATTGPRQFEVELLVPRSPAWSEVLRTVCPGTVARTPRHHDGNAIDP